MGGGEKRVRDVVFPHLVRLLEARKKLGIPRMPLKYLKRFKADFTSEKRHADAPQRDLQVLD